MSHCLLITIKLFFIYILSATISAPKEASSWGHNDAKIKIRQQDKSANNTFPDNNSKNNVTV
jgi:hypothetical protein